MTANSVSANAFVLLEKMEDVSAYSRIALRQFPKYEKFILAAEIRNTIAEIKRLLIRASKRYYKKTTLEDTDIEIEFLRTLIREAHTLKYIDTHHYEVWSLRVNVVGKMLGSWLEKVRIAQDAGSAPIKNSRKI